MSKPTSEEIEKRTKGQKKAEEKLYLQKTYFEKLVNSSPEAILLLDDHDLVIDVNEEFTKMFGYSKQEALGKQINDLVLPDDVIDDASLFSNKENKGKIVEVDSERKRKDGSLLDVSILCAPIIHFGQQKGAYAIYRDITERINAEEELRIEKAYLEELFKSAPEAIVLHDKNDIVVNVNDEFTRMFGYSREESIGKLINDLVASEEYKEHAASNSFKVTHGQRTDNDSKRMRKDGTLFDVWIIGAPIIHKDKQMGVYAIYRDITERKKAEIRRVRSQEEARTAKKIQINFLPKSNPKVEGYDIAGMSIPALNVGGDYYDFIRLDEHRIAICLGDVSGKGLPAALVMSNLQATIRSLATFDLTADECLRKANKLLSRSIDSKTFVSLFYGILDIKKNTLSYANAGQTWPFVLTHGNSTVYLKTHGIALGIVENASYQQKEVYLHPGDSLLIYSDGISEAMNERMETFGDERLQQIIQRFRGHPADGLIEEINAAVNLHFGKAQQNDDMTVVSLIRDRFPHHLG